MTLLQQLSEYLYLKKKSPTPRHSMMRYMHGMNRLSIYIFIVALLIFLFRFLKHKIGH